MLSPKKAFVLVDLNACLKNPSSCHCGMKKKIGLMDFLFSSGQLIFSNEYTQAENQNWHLKHFCCFDCDNILAGEIYVMVNDKPVCKPCYVKNHAVVRSTGTHLPQPVRGFSFCVFLRPPRSGKSRANLVERERVCFLHRRFKTSQFKSRKCTGCLGMCHVDCI